VSPDALVALLEGCEVGRVSRARGNRLTFTYDETWRATEGAMPLSLSMPMGQAQHGHKAVEAFLRGLLPDNEFVLDRWARRFQVSAANPFALVAAVGEDCAGAVQFVRPERVDELRAETGPRIEWLDDAAIAARLRALREDHSAWRRPDDVGQFSLAGAQPKTALICLDGRWGIPSGRTPTTHILKPPTGEFDGFAENEHFCLALARTLGLPAAASEVRQFGDEKAIVVERYDRVRDPAGRQPFLRLHQEDLCQTLGLPPTAKYQSDGGPTPAHVADLLRTYSGRPDEDVGTFVDALAFAWLVAAPDGHAKNYSLIHGGGGRVRLAPLYDLDCALPYSQLDPQRLKLAMKIGGIYRLRDIGRRQWEKLAGEVRRPADEVVERVADIAAGLPDAAEEVRAQAVQEGLAHPMIGHVAARVIERARRCARLLRP